MKNWVLGLAIGTTVTTTILGFGLDPASASTKTFAAGVAVTGGAAVASGNAAATIIGAPAAGWIALGGGATEIGLGICGWLFDPPDPGNAGIPVSIDTYLMYQLPDVFTVFPGGPISLGNAVNSYNDLLDNYVANLRAAQASLDRYAGALLIGRPDFASARLSEANAFKASAKNVGDQIPDAMSSILTEINSLSGGSDFLNLPVTLSDTLALKHQIQNGNFPPPEQWAMDAWNLTTEEKNRIVQYYASTPDSVLIDYFQSLDPVNGNSIPLGDALTNGAEACSDCPPVPEPTSTLSFLALGTLGAASTLKRKLKTSKSSEKETIKIS